MTAPEIADVNWLLSALAQAAAALIAIVGGLLVSRYVVLHAEQQSARRRVEDLERREQEAQAELASAEQALDEYHVDDALDDRRVYEEIFATDGQPTVEGVLDALDRDGQDLNLGVFRERLDRLTVDMREAITAVYPVVPVAETHDDWSDFRRAHGIQPTDRHLWEWVYDRACDERRAEAKRIAREAAKRSPYGALGALSVSNYGMTSSLVVPTYNAATSIIRSQREAATVNGLEVQISGAQAALRALAQERRLAEETYDATRQPEGFKLALQVMSVLAVVGMGLPVAIMGFGPTTLPWWARAVVILVFFGGVGLLLRFLFVYASYLREGGRDSLPVTLTGLLKPAGRSQPNSPTASAIEPTAQRALPDAD